MSAMPTTDFDGVAHLKQHLSTALGEDSKGTLIWLCYQDWRVWCVKTVYMEELASFSKLKPAMKEKVLAKIKLFFKFVFATWTPDVEKNFAKGVYHRGHESMMAFELFKFYEAQGKRMPTPAKDWAERWEQFLTAIGGETYGHI